MKLTQNEMEILKGIICDWLSEGFQAELKSEQRAIFEKLGVNYAEFE